MEKMTSILVKLEMDLIELALARFTIKITFKFRINAWYGSCTYFRDRS